MTVCTGLAATLLCQLLSRSAAGEIYFSGDNGSLEPEGGSMDFTSRYAKARLPREKFLSDSEMSAVMHDFFS